MALPQALKAKQAQYANVPDTPTGVGVVKATGAVPPPTATAPQQPTPPIPRAPQAAPQPPQTQPQDRAELEAQFAVDSEPKADPKPQEPPKAVEPKVDVSKGEDDEDDPKLWKWRFHSLQGNHEKTDRENKDMRQRMLQLEEEIGSLKQERAKLTAPKIEDLTDEETQAFEQSIPVITKIALKQADKVISSHVSQLNTQISQLKEANEALTKQMSGSESNSFIGSVKARVPELETIKNTPEWKKFLTTKSSQYSQRTIADDLVDAHNARDLAGVAAIFEGFKQTNKNLAAVFHSPSMSAATNIDTATSNKKPTLKYSERKRVSDQFRKGQITLDRYNQVKALYDEAEVEGRIDYNQ